MLGLPARRFRHRVSTLRETFRDLSNALRERPDELMLEVGAGGEILLARLRLFLSLLLLLLPAINYASGGDLRETTIGFIGVVMVLAISSLWLALSQRRQRLRWLPFVSAGFDVSLVSLVLVLLAAHSPATGLNSVVVWCLYPLAILTTALRNDVRVSLLVGTLALLQYAAVSAFFLATADGPIVSVEYGTVSLSTQLQRLLLIAMATLVTVVIVFRMHRLVQLSGTDGLTGLPNRSYLTHRVPKILADARAEGETLCLALVDLDHFKRINDELGHQVGDAALRHAVKSLRLELGRDEPMVRTGGEEFVILLRLPLGAAWERMDALRRRLETRPFLPDDESEPRQLTFSAGLACLPQDAIDVSGLLRTADQRLRTAKRTGRNRVIARDQH